MFREEIREAAHGASICLRAAVAAIWLALNIAASSWPDTRQALFLSLRWLAGIIGPLGLVVMTSKTLKIPFGEITRPSENRRVLRGVIAASSGR